MTALSPRSRYYFFLFVLSPAIFGICCAISIIFNIHWVLLVGLVGASVSGLVAGEAKCPACGKTLGEMARSHPGNVFMMPEICDRCEGRIDLSASEVTTKSPSVSKSDSAQ